MGVFTAEGVHWSKQRKLTSPSFSHKNVLEAADVVGNEINLLVDRLQQRLEMTNNHHGVKIIDMDNELAFFAQQTISSIAFGGLKGQVADYFQSLQLTNDLNAWFEYLYQRITFPFPAWLWRLSRFYQTERAARCADERISAHCRSIISSFREELCSEDSRMHTKKCLLLSLMRERSDTDIYLDDEELLANVKTFFIAGSDTTSVVITWMCFYFCTALQPMVTAIRNEIEHVLNKSEHVNGGCGIGIILAKNAANLPLCNAFMKEALRLSGPGAWIGAEYIGSEPLILSNGLKIYQSDEFFVFSDACGRDCSIFPNPDMFDPDRWINGRRLPDAQNLMEKAYIGFGGGPRLCPGMNLALLEGVATFATLVYKFDMRLGCAASEISRKLSFISKANQMPIVLTPRI